MKRFTLFVMFVSLLTSGFILASPKAVATPASYLSALEGMGYTGSIARWLHIGNTVCRLQNEGKPAQAIAAAIVLTTGEGIYMDEGYEIIGAANTHLCGHRTFAT